MFLFHLVLSKSKNEAFSGLYNVQTIEFSDESQLKTIGNQAFWNINQVNEIRLPYGLESIGSEALERCFH